MPKERVQAKTIAEHLLWLRSDSVTTPLHIVKLVYLCHGWMLGLKGRPLVDEPVVTGRYGPVIQSLYDRYSIFGDGPIMGAEVIDHTPDLDPLQLSVVNFVHAVYQEFPDTELSEMTHEPGTPWSKIYKSQGLDVEIPKELIQDHYRQMVTEIRQADHV